jgi:uncharacterized protein (DUF1919 family)
MRKKSRIHHQQIFGNEKIMHVTKNSANEEIMCGRYHNLANENKIIHSPTIVQTKKKSCIHQQFGK